MTDYFFLYYVPQNDSVSMVDAFSFQQLVDNTVQSKKEDSHLHLILHTFGGDPYTAAKIVNILRHRFAKITVVVPYCAMSAGTLIALGADEIVLAETGQIGPLDMQVSHPETEKRISALDYTDSISYILGQTKEATSLLLKELYESSNSRVKMKDAMEIASSSAVELFKPLLEKIDPVQLNKSARILTVAKKYGQEFLQQYSIKRDVLEKEGEGYCDALIRHMIYRMPDHAYGIFYAEADRIGLNVINQDSYTHWGKIWGKITPAIIDFFTEKPSLSKLIIELKLDDNK